jgi:hypothetical protein
MTQASLDYFCIAWYSSAAQGQVGIEDRPAIHSLEYSRHVASNTHVNWPTAFVNCFEQQTALARFDHEFILARQQLLLGSTAAGGIQERFRRFEQQ